MVFLVSKMEFEELRGIDPTYNVRKGMQYDSLSAAACRTEFDFVLVKREKMV